MDTFASCRLTHPVTQQGLAYWMELRRGRRMPRRSDIDPTAIPHLLPHIMLFDVLRDPLDFRYRLIGTVVETFLSRRYTGLKLSEIEHQKAPSRMWDHCVRVASSFEPIGGSVPYVGPMKDFMRMEDVAMPLSDDDKTVNMIFVVVVWVPKNDRP